MTPALLCAGLEVALNRYLRLEPAALQGCARLAGQSIELLAEGLGWSLVIEFIDSGVRVLPLPEVPADVRLRGPLPALLRLGARTAAGDAGLPPGVSIEGDAELLRRFQRLMELVGFDLEEVAAPLIGDVAAHRVFQGLRELVGWGRRSAGTLAQDTAEYLREETRDLARAPDVEDWMGEIETLREQADRFEARLLRLERKLGSAE